MKKLLSILLVAIIALSAFVGCQAAPAEAPAEEAPAAEAPAEEADKVASIVKREMEHAVKMRVSMQADVGVGKSWYESK